MAGDQASSLRDALTGLQSKHAYFLLAAAGASIGFALTRTQSLPLSWSQLPLLVAIVCWALSFYFGCLQIRRVQYGMLGQVNFLEAMRDNPSLGDDLLSKIKSDVDERLDRCAEDAGHYADYQFALLVVGACAYISWQIIEMSAKAAG